MTRSLRLSLPQLLQRIALAALGTACGGKVADTGDRIGYDIDLCAPTGAYVPVQGVTPASGPIDYLELREQVPEARGSSSVNFLYADGTPCATATSSACLAAFRAARSSQGWAPPGDVPAGTRRYLVYTRGDEVGVVDTTDAVVRFFAPIDSPREAALVATTRSYYFECGRRVRARGDGSYELVASTGGTCGRGKHLDEHVLVVTRDGQLDELSSTRVAEGDPSCIAGRRPAGLCARAADASEACADDLGAFLSDAARMEAASVPAFATLARELAFHGAPAELVARALAARDDEVAHAATTRALAARFGAAFTAPEVVVDAPRDRLAIALENAVEGCVHETFAAVLAAMQAARAADPELARAYAVIARDEARHAALAWDVAAWLASSLDADECARVRSARDEAVRTLAASVDGAPPRSERVQRLAGWPEREATQRALAALRDELWAA